MKTDETFPANFNYGFQVMLKISEMNSIGLFYSGFSTSGKISDFSGNINFDQILSVNTYGFVFEHYLSKNKIVNMLLSARLGGNFYELEFKTKSDLEEYSSQREIYSVGSQLCTLFVFEKIISPVIIRFDVGFNVGDGVCFYESGNFELKFGTNTPQGVGFNSGLSLGFEL